MAPRQVTYCHPSPPSLSLSHSPLKGDSSKFQLIDTQSKAQTFLLLSREFSCLSVDIWILDIWRVRRTSHLSSSLSFMRLDETAVKSVRKVAKGRRAMWHFTLRELRERVSKGHVFPLSSPSVALRPFYDPVFRTLSRIDERNDAVDARQKGGCCTTVPPHDSRHDFPYQE